MDLLVILEEFVDWIESKELSIKTLDDLENALVAYKEEKENED